MATKKRSTTANGKKPSTRKTAPRARTRKVAAPETPTPIAVADEPAPPAPSGEAMTVVTVVPEPAFAARIAPPPPPRPRPEQRRGIFFDVENTSRAQDIEQVLRYLVIDRVGIDTDFTAVGNWRVIGHETARLLAQNGANLVHSAPSVGVRDWSDLRIAVGAGVWLAGARPGDMIDIVSDDQAFDAVGDVASSLGVQYRRLSYRSLRGHVAAEITEPMPSSDDRSRRRGRGGRGRRGGTARRQSDMAPRHADERPRHHEPAPRHHAPAARHEPAPRVEELESDVHAHTAPHDELIDVVRDLMRGSPSGVTLDQLANGLRERGFRRTSGSPRLITRLKRIKELEMTRTGLIRVLGEGESARHEPAPSAPRPPRAETGALEPAEDDDDVPADGEPDGEGDADSDGAPVEGAAEGTAEGGARRRRRRRGGRRRRGRRGGGGNGGGTDAESGGSEVIAAAPPSTPEF